MNLDEDREDLGVVEEVELRKDSSKGGWERRELRGWKVRSFEEGEVWLEFIDFPGC